ncbi:DUF4476 domain-containing protein [Vitiosangium sp. GDMCC 1.1324]|uniref:DUF4476 domain-containing protein n=1 Tax=Vitiosangium sp. (strain GDMCC 1.1324) TaxID=2138576 RepID=UPI000D3BE161|nr:DUF4476 domain-containing protein [Vitiosangium sp. GDMCC 1.1324]PTL76686.1 hypothetical protein DAT35_48010 [Vitiosangium sp. GDMCC 1.1324]
MKALFVAITLLTAVTASAQTAPTIAPPPGQATGSAPPTSSAAGFRGDDNAEFRRGRFSTMVVVDREEMERRLANLEALIGEAFERGGRGGSRGKLREAYEELKDIREQLADAPDVRGYNPRPTPPPPPPPPAYQPISDGRLQKIVSAMSREPFGEDKMNVLEGATQDSYFLVNQVQQVLSQFQFSKDRLQAVRLLWSRVLDRQNGFQLYNAFPMSSDKAELKRIISG